MDKEEVQKRVLRAGKPIKLNQFEWTATYDATIKAWDGAKITAGRDAKVKAGDDVKISAFCR